MNDPLFCVHATGFVSFLMHEKKKNNVRWTHDVRIFRLIFFLFSYVYGESSNYKADIAREQILAGLTRIVCCPASCSCSENNTDRKHSYDDNKNTVSLPFHFVFFFHTNKQKH